MSSSTRKHTRAISAAAAGALLLAVVPAAGAHAAAAATPSSCTITGISPKSVTISGSPVSKNFVPVVKGCSLKTATSWSIDFGNGNVVKKNGNPGFVFGPEDFDNAHMGSIQVKVKVKEPGEDGASKSVAFSFLRRATWGTSFNASPEPVKKGKSLTIKGVLKRVSLNFKKKPPYVAYTKQTVQIQFEAAGSKTFTTVKKVKTGAGGKIDTTVTATKTGTWRVYFGGSSTTATSYSHTDGVKVS